MRERVRRTGDEDQWKGSMSEETSAVDEVHEAYCSRCLWLRIFASQQIHINEGHGRNDLHDVACTTQQVGWPVVGSRSSGKRTTGKQ